MTGTEFPGAEEYAAERACFRPMTVVDIQSRQAVVTDAYRNEVLFDVNGECVRLAVFEGEYRWHHHPDSDELFVVVAGELQIDFEHTRSLTLSAWQSVVIPAATVHRTRAIGRTVNLTFERRGAQTVFVDSPPVCA